MTARQILRGPVFALMVVALIAGAKRASETEVDLGELDFREGDIVFQHLPGKMGSVICDVTDSQLSHCGLVVYRKGQPHVLEAVGPVRYVSLKKWLKQGERSQFTQMRLKNVSDEQITKSIKAADRLLGRPYDILYELDDAKIYCSELVYKAYLRGAGIEVGEKQRLGDLKWQPHEQFIRAITGGDLPLKRELVSPESVARSPHLKLVYSNFPFRADEPTHDQTVLAGHWSGEYTIKGQSPLSATVEFDRDGAFSNGTIRLADGRRITIRELRVEPFESKREFTAQLNDARGIVGDLNARIRDAGRRIIGGWVDDRGNRGVFSFEKQLSDLD